MENTDRIQTRREQLRAAQKRWRDKKRSALPVVEVVEPKSYTKAYRTEYHKKYYEKNREKILERLRQKVTGQG